MPTEKQKIILSSVLGGVSLWIIDSAIDSVFFSNQPFLASLILDISFHELYFRTLFLASFIAFGFIVAKSFHKRKLVQDELKQAIEKLAAEKARSESIISAIGDGISIQDNAMRVLYQNQVHKNLVGEQAGEICYRVYANSEQICEGCPVVLSMQDGKIHTLEKSLARDSKVIYLEIKSSPLRDQKGTIIAGIEAVRDITDRKNATEKLKLFSEAMEEAMDGVQIVDREGYIIYSNKAVQEIYGYTPQELAGRNVNEMNVDKEFADRVIIPKIKEAGRWSGEVMVLHKNGTPFPVWLSTSLVNDHSGGPMAMVGIIRDMTERKQAEEIIKRHRQQLVRLVEERTAELSSTNEKLRREIADREKMEEELFKVQKLESLGILAGGIAHDFNNLLASMLGNISLAMLDLDREHPAFRQLAAAEKASIRAQDLTRQLLTFSKGGAPVKKTTDLGELIRESSGFALRGSRIRCEVFLADDLRLVDIDEGQISQVIHNLVINADHAMPDGGIISIHCGNIDLEKGNLLSLREGEYVMISIEDQGVGIPKEHLRKIFDPYFTTKQKGSGLGLATSYSIVRKHGGHITVASELGSGTLFHIYLPASRQKAGVKKSEETAIIRGEGKILVMDDETEVRETTGNVLKRLGYQVDYAADGKEAIELYQKARDAGKGYHAVIMDLTVPGGMGGKEAIKKLREIDPRVKAIVSSGYSNDPILADFKMYGFKGVVAKPYRLKDLSDAVYKAIAEEA
jgi:PAS domain S-box-containing protein